VRLARGVVANGLGADDPLLGGEAWRGLGLCGGRMHATAARVWVSGLTNVFAPQKGPERGSSEFELERRPMAGTTA
jgi:hypothetical protein